MSNETTQIPDEKPTRPGVVDSDYPTLDIPTLEEATPEPESADSKEDKDLLAEDEGIVDDGAIEDNDEAITNTLVMINSQVTLTREPSEKLNVAATTTVALPNATPMELEKIGGALGELLSFERSPRTLHEEIMVKMIPHSMLGDMFTTRLKGEGSDWQQSIEIDGKQIRPSKPFFKNTEGGEKITGDHALVELDKHYGLGGLFTIPLVHSGIWLSLRPPSNIDYAAIDEKLRSEKDDFGKRTLGMVFSNNKTYIVNHLMDFIEDHIQDCSLKGWEDIGLRNVIKVTDLLVLAAAMGYTLYPNGFEYVSACTGSVGCDHIYNGRLKIPNCIWFDRSAFTKSQKVFMSDRLTKHTLEEILKYQEESDDSNNFYDVSDSLRVYFKVPTIGDNIYSGYRWFEDIENTIVKAFGANLERDKTNEYMTRRIGLSVLRQYGHFFKMIKFTQTGNFIEDEEDINNALIRLSGVHDILDTIIEQVGKYIENNTKALVAIPRYNCPSCGKIQTQQMKEHPVLIPIDPVNLFFTLGDQKNQYGSQS